MPAEHAGANRRAGAGAGGSVGSIGEGREGVKLGPREIGCPGRGRKLTPANPVVTALEAKILAEYHLLRARPRDAQDTCGTKRENGERSDSGLFRSRFLRSLNTMAGPPQRSALPAVHRDRALRRRGCCIPDPDREKPPDNLWITCGYCWISGEPLVNKSRNSPESLIRTEFVPHRFGKLEQAPSTPYIRTAHRAPSAPVTS